MISEDIVPNNIAGLDTMELRDGIELPISWSFDLFIKLPLSKSTTSAERIGYRALFSGVGEAGSKMGNYHAVVKMTARSGPTLLATAHSQHNQSIHKMQSSNQKQQQHQPDGSDSNKKESTNSGGNDDTPSTSSSKPKDIIHQDVCSICFDDVSLLDINTYVTYTCCGKVMHKKCHIRLQGTSSLNFETRNSCPMCRAPNVADGSKEDVERLQKWSLRGRSWSQFNLGSLYARGVGVTKDPKRACELFKLAADQGHHCAQYNLAGMYALGQGVTQSDTLSFKYYKLCADQGYVFSFQFV